MAKSKKTWSEKLHDSKGLPRVEEITSGMSQRWGSGTVVIPAPIEVDELMRSVPRGRLSTINMIREALARKHNASIGCPMTTGIFAWVAAHAAEEALAEGRGGITPYWRTLKAGGYLNPKYPGGAELQSLRLEAEGFTILPSKGKKPPRVKDYELYLYQV